MQPNRTIASLSFAFALDILNLSRILVVQKEFVLSKQLLRCGTSIGANVEEASAAQTKKDFITKMSIASKEARESRFWLKLLKESKTANLEYQPYLQKVEDLIRILTKIVKTAQQNLKPNT